MDSVRSSVPVQNRGDFRAEKARRSQIMQFAVMAGVAGAWQAGLVSRVSANTQNTFTSTSSKLLGQPANWDQNVASGAAYDFTFGAANPTVATAYQIGTALTWGSFNDLNANGITLRPVTGTTVVVTLGGTTSTGNSVSGTSSDLIYVAAGGSLTATAQNGTAALLTMNLAQSGNIDIATNAQATFGTAITDTNNGGYTVTKIGSGTFITIGANTFSGPLVISAGTFQIGDGTSANGSLGTGAITDNGIMVFNRTTNNFSSNSTISGSGSVIKLGANLQALLGTNTYQGGTQIMAGAIQINNPTSALGSGLTTVNSGATLKGIGATGGAVTVLSGGTITAGLNATTGTNATPASVGVLSTTDQTWSSGGTFLAKLDLSQASPATSAAGASATAGTTNDSLSMTTLSPPSSGFAITLAPLSTASASITSAGTTYYWQIATVSGSGDVFANAANQFTFGVSGITTGGGTFSLADNYNPANGLDFLDVVYTAAPEPAAVVMLGAIASVMTLRRRRTLSSQGRTARVNNNRKLW